MPLIFVFNYLGLGMLVVGAVMFASLDGLLTRAGAGMIAAGLLVLMDLGWRAWKFLTAKEEADLDSDVMAFVSPRRGGNLVLLPVWIIGVLLLFFCGQIVFGTLLK